MPHELKDQVFEILLQIADWEISSSSFPDDIAERITAQRTVSIAKTYRKIQFATARAARESDKLLRLVNDHFEPAA